MSRTIDRSHVFYSGMVHPGGCWDCDRLWEIIEAWTELLLWGAS